MARAGLHGLRAEPAVEIVNCFADVALSLRVAEIVGPPSRAWSLLHELPPLFLS